MEWNAKKSKFSFFRPNLSRNFDHVVEFVLSEILEVDEMMIKDFRRHVLEEVYQAFVFMDV